MFIDPLYPPLLLSLLFSWDIWSLCYFHPKCITYRFSSFEANCLDTITYMPYFLNHILVPRSQVYYLDPRLRPTLTFRSAIYIKFCWVHVQWPHTLIQFLHFSLFIVEGYLCIHSYVPYCLNNINSSCFISSIVHFEFWHLLCHNPFYY